MLLGVRGAFGIGQKTFHAAVWRERADQVRGHWLLFESIVDARYKNAFERDSAAVSGSLGQVFAPRELCGFIVRGVSARARSKAQPKCDTGCLDAIASTIEPNRGLDARGRNHKIPDLHP